MNVDNEKRRPQRSATVKRGTPRTFNISLVQEPKQGLQQAYVTKTMAMIETAVHALLDHTTMGCTLHEVYSAVESIYRLGSSLADQLWKSLYEILKQHVHLQLEPVVIVANSFDHDGSYRPNSIDFMKLLVKSCNYVQADLAILERVLCYLDRGFLRTSTRPGVYAAGIDLLRNYVEMDQVNSAILCALKSLLYEARLGNTTNCMVTNDVFLLAKTISPNGLYPKLIPTSEESLEQYINTDLLPAFQSKRLVEYLRSIEAQRNAFKDYLSFLDADIASIYSNMPDTILKTALTCNADRIQTEIPIMIVTHDSESYKLLGELSALFDKQPEYYNAVATCVSTELPRILDAKYPATRGNGGSIQEIIRFRENLANFVKAQHSPFSSRLNRSINGNWSSVIMSNTSYDEQIIEGLAKYIDRLVKQKEDIPEEKLKSLMMVFTTIEGKDIFRSYYQRDLARRLLGNKSTLDCETQIIRSLKNECGKLYTQDLEVMCTDMAVSKELTTDFRASTSGASIRRGINFGVNILTDGKWPRTGRQSTVRLPAHLQQPLRAFEEFYDEKHRKRKLTWLPARDMVVVKGMFDSGPRELYMNIFQAVVILMFNNTSENILTYKQITASAGMAKEDLNPALHSLVAGRVCILSITRQRRADSGTTPAGKVEEYEDDDEFRVLEDIREKQYKLLLSGYKVGGGGSINKERADVRVEVEQTRNLELQATIVRLLKSRKRMSHSELFKNVTELIMAGQGRGRRAGGRVVEVGEFKKAIEELMAPGNPYLVRDPADSGVYLYSI